MTGGRGRLDAIWIKRARGLPMDACDRARVVAGWGLEGNANQGGFRQVTVLSAEAWEAALADLGVAADRLPPATRRANLLVAGVDLAGSRKRVLRVGGMRLRVLGETRPCNLMEESWPGLLAALAPDWRGGVFGEVLGDASIAVGDPVAWDEHA